MRPPSATLCVSSMTLGPPPAEPGHEDLTMITILRIEQRHGFSGSTTTTSLRAMGWTCRRETISGQGYFGGDGITCYRVRDDSGGLVMPCATYRRARDAWAAALRTRPAAEALRASQRARAEVEV